jgi:hypothetical protein
MACYLSQQARRGAVCDLTKQHTTHDNAGDEGPPTAPCHKKGGRDAYAPMKMMPPGSTVMTTSQGAAVRGLAMRCASTVSVTNTLPSSLWWVRGKEEGGATVWRGSQVSFCHLH